MKRKGRPPLLDGKKKAVRLEPYLYENLRSMAKANGRSISSEAGQRLKESFERIDPEEYRPIVKDIIELYGI